MSEIVKNRSELIFLYDVRDTNPNGDPMDENKPRIDEETGKNIVTDVRLKRTIRDYLHDFKGEEIFVREIADDKGDIQDAKLRAEDFLYEGKPEKKIEKSSVDLPKMRKVIEDNVLRECIDVRLFGVTMPIEKDTKNKSSITHTGPVQFNMGRSMHKVVMKHIKGTGAFASKQGSEQKTFREEDVLPYSLIRFYGIINENLAQKTRLTNEDVTLLIDGIWNGTKNLTSRSKTGQMPRLLIKVNYKEKDYHIGDLDKLIVLKSDLLDEKIRDIAEVNLDMIAVKKKLEENKDKILSIDYLVDERVNLVSGEKAEKFDFKKSLSGIKTEEIKL